MSVKRQIVQVSDEGVQSVIADLQKINAGLDVTDRKAKQTAGSVDKAGGGGGLQGFLERAKGQGFLKRSGLEFGPLEIGRHGLGLSRSALTGSVGVAAFAVVATAHITNSLLTTGANVREQREGGKSWADIGAGLVREGATQPFRKINNLLLVTDSGEKLGKIFGVRQEEYEEAYGKFSDLFGGDHDAQYKKDFRARQKAIEAGRAEITAAGKRATDELAARLRNMQAGIDKELSRALSGLYKETKLGIRFAGSSDMRRAQGAIREMREQQLRDKANQAKRDAAKNMPNHGG